MRDELPHSITVTIEEMGLRPGRKADQPLLNIYASLIVERGSQKGISSAAAVRLRELGTAASPPDREPLATPVYLDLPVKMLKSGGATPST